MTVNILAIVSRIEARRDHAFKLAQERLGYDYFKVGGKKKVKIIALQERIFKNEYSTL